METVRWWLLVGVVPCLFGCSDFVSATSDGAASSGGVTPDSDTTGSGPGPSSTTGATSTGDSNSSSNAVTDADDESDSESTAVDPTLPDVPPNCGDGIRDDGETCDDGNEDNADECTVLCQPPTCDDGIQSGSETAVDCGGPGCDGCTAGDACGDVADCVSGLLCDESCAFPRSCLELLEANDEALDGDYVIDPLGDGSLIDVECDMQGGGWTLVFEENFEAFVDNVWTENDTFNCGGSTVLGRFRGSDSPVARTVPLLGVPHAQVRLRAEYLVIDSWDDENGRVSIDGTEVFSTQCNIEDCGQTGNLCGGGWWDSVLDVEGTVPNVDDDVVIAFESTTDQDIDDESFGIDAVRVAVR